MRTLLCAIPALLTLAGTALAEPQQLDEAQLGGIAAGQDVPGISVSTSEFNNTSTALSTTNSVAETVNQSLGGMSSNTTYSTGIGSANVGATGSAFTAVTGSITGGSSVP
jgi:hypothetical protein